MCDQKFVQCQRDAVHGCNCMNKCNLGVFIVDSFIVCLLICSVVELFHYFAVRGVRYIARNIG